MHFVPLGKAGWSPSLSFPLVLLQPLRQFGQQWSGPVWLQSCKNQTEVRFSELLCLLTNVRAEATRPCTQGPQSSPPGFLGHPRWLPGWKCVWPWFGFIWFYQLRHTTEHLTSLHIHCCLISMTFLQHFFLISFKTSVLVVFSLSALWSVSGYSLVLLMHGARIFLPFHAKSHPQCFSSGAFWHLSYLKMSFFPWSFFLDATFVGLLLLQVWH